MEVREKLFTKNFTLLVLGQISSLFGNYILRLALSMYVLEMTGSAAVFAGILSAAVIPAIILSPLGGILADRADRRKVMVALDFLTGLSVLAAAVILEDVHGISAAVLQRQQKLAVISALLIVLSVLGAFETPTVQACIPSMLSGDNIIRGNAAVNQVASISYLTAPVLGGLFYAAVGLQPVMYASVGCFFATALLECFIRLKQQPHQAFVRGIKGMLSVVWDDFLVSIRFIAKERADMLKMLVLAALSRFFVMGIALVGLPFIIREILGLGAGYYGAAESALAVATIAGSIAAGLLTGKLRQERLYLVLGAIGICMLPAGAVFLFQAQAAVKYAAIVASFGGMQIAISIFSIFAVSMIQQNTPEHLIGKVMAYTSAITMCAQPAGQMVYGFLFDGFKEAVYLVLLPTGAAVFGFGLLSAGFFRRWAKNDGKQEDRR